MITNTLSYLGIDGPTTSDILKRMTEPHRHYHTVSHVQDILYNINLVCVNGSEAARYMIAAAWFHDIIYDVHSNTNEEDSASYSRTIVMPDIDPDVLSNIILATRSHEPNTFLQEIFCDLDLMILASNWEIYIDYVMKIRREYAHVSDHDFNHHRANFLRKMMGKRLFHTMPQLESLAHRNIERELTLYEV
jgi:predicted metal-dependent HD superfamily phosphohydrolase